MRSVTCVRDVTCMRDVICMRSVTCALSVQVWCTLRRRDTRTVSWRGCSDSDTCISSSPTFTCSTARAESVVAFSIACSCAALLFNFFILATIQFSHNHCGGQEHTEALLHASQIMRARSFVVTLVGMMRRTQTSTRVRAETAHQNGNWECACNNSKSIAARVL